MKIFIDTVVGCLDSTLNLRVLDIGTGNGFVAKTISERAEALELNIDLYAIDLSDAMLEQARQFCDGFRNIKIEKRDNNSTGYEDDYFDVVVAKNVTSFNVEEIYRILKPGGKLVMKEYGRGKGLLEITALFPGRVTSRSPEAIAADFRLKTWKYIYYTQFFYRSEMSIKDVQAALRVAPIIQNFFWDRDKYVIQKFFKRYAKKSVTSDPWILYAEK